MTRSSQLVEADVSGATIRQISLEQLETSRNNPRRTMNETDLKELAASIREHGVQVPLLVRPDPDYFDTDETRHEIVAGHRRAQAAHLAGLKRVPCIVRDLTDEQAAEIALIDNLQRVDVPPLEEADAFDALLDRLLSIEAVAATVGKEQSYVAKRLKLRTLTEHTRRALAERLITIDHAMLLCRLGEDEQNAALKWCLDHSAGSKKPVEKVIDDRLASVRRDPRQDEDVEDPEEPARRPSFRFTWESQSVQKLKDHIETETGTPLDRAPWPMDEDWLLPDVGSCLDCPQNTKANAPLFGDLDMGVAVCTDGGCFKAKTEAFVHIQQEKAAKDSAAELGRKSVGDVQILRVSWKQTSTPPRQLKDGGGANPAQLFREGQWVEATKACANAVLSKAVTVDWREAHNGGHGPNAARLRKPGEILAVCIEPKCKMHPKAYERTAASSNGVSAENEKKQQQDRAKFEAFVAAEEPVRRALYDAVLAKMKPDTVKRNLLLGMNANYDICKAVGFESDDWDAREKHAQGLIQKAGAGELDALLFHVLYGRALIVDGRCFSAKDKGRGRLREMAKMAGVDAAAIERKFEAAAKPAAKKAAAKPATKKPAEKAAKAAPKKAVKAAAKKAARKGGRA